MNRIAACLAVGSLLTLSACTKGTVSGTVTNGLSKAPVPELRILARSEAPDQTCKVFETTTDASGNYSFDGLCAGQTYTLSPGEDGHFFMGTQEVSGDEQAPGNALTAWQGPEGAGVYVLKADGSMESQRTKADVAKATIFETEQSVRYPTGTPGSWPAVASGDYLVLVGKATIENQQMFPLVESPEVKFNPDRDGLTHFSLGQAWLYIGAKIDEGVYTEMKTELDATKVVNAEHGERAAQYIPADAVPAGKYAMLTTKAKRTYMFEFGGAADVPAEEAPATEEPPAAK
ncbi:MAG: hypothetical protein ACI9VR_004014 [Cognaticolwellia sp.]|jgi:hypothetical protein